MNKLWWVVIVVVVAGATLLFTYYKPNQTNDETIKIGAILPMTSDFGFLGQEINRGALIAVEEAQSEGMKVEYISEDDGYTTARMAGAANKLVSVDKVDAAFVGLGDEAKPTVNIFNAAKVPLLVAWDSNNELKTFGKYIFSIGFSSEKDGALLADFAHDKLGLKKVFIVETINPVAVVIDDVFEARYKEFGGSIQREKIQYDQKDHRTVVAKIQDANVDGVYVCLIPPQNSSFLPQLRRAGFTKPVLSCDTMISSEIEGAGQAAEGVYFSNIYAERADTVAQKYREQFGSDTTETTLVSFGYDSVRTLLEAYKIAELKNISLRDALTEVKYEGLGATIDMQGGQFSERIEKIFKVQNGKPVEVK